MSLAAPGTFARKQDTLTALGQKPEDLGMSRFTICGQQGLTILLMCTFEQV